MTYLVGRGYRRIAYLFPYSWVLEQPDEPRHRAYREACEAADLVPQLIQMEHPEETRRSGLAAGLALAAMPAQDRPQVVLCFNDVVAQGVLFGLRRAGLRVPDDLAVLGFDGLEESQCLDIPLTTVRLPPDEMCQAALHLLLRRIKEGREMPPTQVIIPTQLILGETA
jgi:DNA-binding LacI/PurR family transcriptional regulator